MDINDIDIILEVLDGDTDKYAVLIDKYKNKIFKIVSMHVPQEYVEEVANDIFFKSYKSLKNFKNDSPFINWLTVIAVRTCKDFWRQKYAQKDVPMSSFDEETEQTIELGIDYRTPEDNILGDEKYNYFYDVCRRKKCCRNSFNYRHDRVKCKSNGISCQKKTLRNT